MNITNWIPAPRFRGDKFTPAKAGAGMTVWNYRQLINRTGISRLFCQADTDYRGTSNKVIRLPVNLAGRSILAKSCINSAICSRIS
jgi:hypothetical protein